MMSLKVVALEEALELVTLDLEIAREQGPGAYSHRSAHSSICQIQYLENYFLKTIHVQTVAHHLVPSTYSQKRASSSFCHIQRLEI